MEVFTDSGNSNQYMEIVRELAGTFATEKGIALSTPEGLGGHSGSYSKLITLDMFIQMLSIKTDQLKISELKQGDGQIMHLRPTV